MDGVHTGLNYLVLFARLDRLAPDPEHWQQLYGDLRVLEQAALEQMAEDRT